MRVKTLLLAVVFLHVSCISGKITDWVRSYIDSPAKVSVNVQLIFTPDAYNVIHFPMKNLPYLLTHPQFNASLPTVFFFHGFMASGKTDSAVLAIRGAYVDRGDHNVVTVDWSYYSKNVNYQTAVIPQLKIIAEKFAEVLYDFLNEGYDVNNIHLVGHSLGGQTIGKVGRHLKMLSNGKLVIPRIFALDPAGPGFVDHPTPGFDAITRTDAAYVQIIHTCAGILGMQQRVGSADFYPDGGTSHPGCDSVDKSSVLNPKVYICDHSRAWQFYQASVRQPEAFPAVRCNSWDDFLTNGTCYRNEIVNMGFGANPNSNGKYFLETRGNIFNMSRGMDGVRPIEINITRLNALTEDPYPPMEAIPSNLEDQVVF